MDNLNVDCLVNIFEMLTLEEQFAMFHADESKRFVMEDIWSRQYKKVDFNELTYFRYADKKDYQLFMAAISNSVTDIIIHQRAYDGYNWSSDQYAKEKNWLERLSAISELTFPKLQSLLVALDYDLPTIINFGSMFPCLKHFNLYYLQCPDTDTHNLVQSLGTIHNCKMLRKLCINSTFLEKILDEVVNLPSLYKITTNRLDGNNIHVEINLLNRLAKSSVRERVHTLNTNLIPERAGIRKCANQFPNLHNVTMRGRHDPCALSNGFLDGMDDLKKIFEKFCKQRPRREVFCSPMYNSYRTHKWNDHRPIIDRDFVPHYEAVNNIEARFASPCRRLLGIQRDLDDKYTPLIGFNCEWELVKQD